MTWHLLLHVVASAAFFLACAVLSFLHSRRVTGSLRWALVVSSLGFSALLCSRMMALVFALGYSEIHVLMIPADMAGVCFVVSRVLFRRVTRRVSDEELHRVVSEAVQALRRRGP